MTALSRAELCRLWGEPWAGPGPRPEVGTAFGSLGRDNGAMDRVGGGGTSVSVTTYRDVFAHAGQLPALAALRLYVL